MGQSTCSRSLLLAALRLRSSKPFLMKCHFEMTAGRRCGEENDLSAFYTHSGEDGHLHICKVCIRSNGKNTGRTTLMFGNTTANAVSCLIEKQLKRLSQRQTDLGRRPAQNVVCNAVRDGKLLRPNNQSLPAAKPALQKATTTTTASR